MSNKYGVNPDLYFNHESEDHYVYVCNDNVVLLNKIGHIIISNINDMSIDELVLYLKNLTQPVNIDIKNDVQNYVNELLRLGLVFIEE